jgi:hypothetical protein
VIQATAAGSLPIMQILRVRRGFQADHSSSSYLFYAADKPVNEQGRRTAHRYSSRAEVEKRSVRYHKWGDYTLSGSVYKALLSEHYNVMVSESYDWWTFMIVVPQMANTKPLPTRYSDARGYHDLGVEVEKFGSRWAISIYCVLDYNELAPAYVDDDPMENLVKLLVAVRKEIIKGDFSFLDAVVNFYGEEAEQLPTGECDQTARFDPKLTKAQLEADCQRHGIVVRKSWTKEQLRNALEKQPREERRAQSKGLSRAARQMLDCLGRI